MSLTHPILNQLYASEHEIFDYPDYGGLPARISRYFTPEDVDAIQYHWDDRRDTSRTEWKQGIADSLRALGGKFRTIKRKKA